MFVLPFRSVMWRPIFVFVCTATLFVAHHTAHAADVVLSPASGSYSAGQTFTTTIQVDPAGDSINAVEATLSFDTAALNVVSIGKTGSVFTLWPVEPTFSNSAGTITFGGGHTAPITSRSTLLTVTFRTVAEGAGSVSFDSASILAADGLGTDVMEASTGASYTVTPAVAVEETATPVEPTAETSAGEEENAAISFGDPPRAPEVGSQAFLEPDVWYDITDGLFTWDLPFDVNVVAVELATSSSNVPTTEYDPPIEEFAINSENTKDGVQFLSIRFKNQVGWGAVTNRRIQIDTTPPDTFDIVVQTSNSQTGFPLLVFEANDETSGIEKYEVFVADKEPFEVSPEEAKLGYLLKELEDGTYTVRVIAYDLAGNKTESSAPVLITAGWITPVESEDTSSFWSFLTANNILIALLILIIIGQFFYIMYERRSQKHTEEKLRKETREIQDQMEKIFSALRDEIYDQVVAITKRPRLSKKEREAVEGLNQALEVSETLIEKEISDVSKILK